jgi:hypothetical protein
MSSTHSTEQTSGCNNVRHFILTWSLPGSHNAFIMRLFHTPDYFPVEPESDKAVVEYSEYNTSEHSHKQSIDAGPPYRAILRQLYYW